MFLWAGGGPSLSPPGFQQSQSQRDLTSFSLKAIEVPPTMSPRRLPATPHLLWNLRLRGLSFASVCDTLSHESLRGPLCFFVCLYLCMCALSFIPIFFPSVYNHSNVFNVDLLVLCVLAKFLLSCEHIIYVYLSDIMLYISFCYTDHDL